MKDYEVISSYSVEQALDDVVLVKLSDLFKKEVDECGILIPVYCTNCVVKRVNPTLCTCIIICDGYSFTILEIDED